MEDPDKASSSSLPQITGQPDFQANDILVLQHLLTETEPLTALYTTECIDPQALHFIPENAWTSQNVSLQFLYTDYFGRKNNVNRRFEHKLWNALRITSAFPNMTKLVGVVWVTDTVMKVYKHPFARLLNITAIDGALFHKQGNFTRHGFVTLNDTEAKAKVPPEHLHDVDFRDVLLLTHRTLQFTMLSGEGNISTCRWDNPTTVARVASLRIETLNDAQ